MDPSVYRMDTTKAKTKSKEAFSDNIYYDDNNPSQSLIASALDSSA